MGSDKSQDKFDIFLCYSDSETDQKFAKDMMEEWGEKFEVRTTKNPPLTTGNSMSNFLDPFKGKFFFITIISMEFFTSTARGWFDDYLEHKRSENSEDALNSFPGVEVIQVMRISEDKAAAIYPSCKEWNSIDSCIGAASTATLIERAHQQIQGFSIEITIIIIDILIHTHIYNKISLV